MRTEPQGAIWRRWDLHFHSTASFDYENKGLTPEQIAAYLIEAGVEVVAVTDHHVMDTKLIRKMQAAAPDCLIVLPGIELRCELGGKESIHYIGIFSEDCNIEDVWTKLQGKLEISPADVIKKGNDKIYVPFEKGCEAIRELGGIITVHAGRKTNGIENISNADAVKRTVKGDLLQKHIHCFEVGRPSDCDDYRKIVFPHLGKTPPLLLCSDNHNAAKYVKCPMWIKADPGFHGLLQLITEPASRVFIGDEPPSLARVRQDSTKYMQELAFNRTASAKPADKWFHGAIPLNTGLVAVIGDKGSGKSAVADILALLGNTHTNEPFSFLRRERFLQPKAKLGPAFEAEVSWCSGKQVKRPLNWLVDPTVPELVKYIPQNYLETICTELKESNDTQFDKELMDVIYSHVSEPDRLGKETLKDLISYVTSETEQRLVTFSEELAGLNSAIFELEEQDTAEHRKSLEAQLDQRRLELKAHEEAQPPEVKQPAEDPAAQSALGKISEALATLDASVSKLKEDIVATNELDKTSAVKVAAAEKLISRITNLERTYNSFLADSADDAHVLELDLKTAVSLTVNKVPIEQARAIAEHARQAVRESLDQAKSGSLTARLDEAVRLSKDQRDNLDAPNRSYQAYLQGLKAWQDKRSQIIGSSTAAGTVAGIEARIVSLADLPHRIEQLNAQRVTLVVEIFATKELLLSRYRELYAPVQGFIDAHPISKKHGTLQFRASIATDGIENMLGMIHQGRKGVFQGEAEGLAKLRELVAAADFTSSAGTVLFVQDLLHRLTHDTSGPKHTPTRIADQVRQNVKTLDVYNFIFGLSYLKPRFELMWQDKPLDLLSPGERGNLLLVFYLLIDKRDVPLIIDQPEENLDNRTIASMLVPAVKDAKERRQIIMVTHNPNLAVVCDADQIIHAHLDKAEGNKVTYTSGAIENPAMTQLIIDVLEGTKPAFDLRDAKYGVLEASRRINPCLAEA